MQFISSKLKKFDVHRKTTDSVKDQTVAGAVITVLSFIIIGLLLYSNIAEYFKADIATRMVLDNSVGIEDVKLVFNVSFFFVPCKDISFKQEVIRGTLHHHDPEIFLKEDFYSNLVEDDKPGCTATGSLIIDKAGGNFMLITSAVEGPVDPSANALDGLLMGFGIQAHHHRTPQNLGHIVNRIEFLPADEEKNEYIYVHEPLFGEQNSPETDTGIFHYAIQVVPTQHKFLNGSISSSNQYSYTDRNVKASDMMFGVQLHGQQFKNQFGLVFTYDFYPIMLLIEEESEFFLSFLTNLCAIVGGTVTILGILDAVIHSSSKAIIGKKD